MKKNSALEDLAFDVEWQEGVTLARMRSKVRHAEVVAARRTFSKRAVDMGFSYPQIGRFLGKHHTTILHLARTENSWNPR